MFEQNARKALGISDRGYVFEIRRNKYEDLAANLLEDAGESCTWAGEGESNL
jgi:ABC-type branched-subunit amino acid transport system ATPase component